MYVLFILLERMILFQIFNSICIYIYMCVYQEISQDIFKNKSAR